MDPPFRKVQESYQTQPKEKVVQVNTLIYIQWETKLMTSSGPLNRLMKTKRSTSLNHILSKGETSFLGVVGEGKKPWVVNGLLNETLMEFHIVTTAEVSLISDLTFQKLHNTVLFPPYVSSEDLVRKR